MSAAFRRIPRALGRLDVGIGRTVLLRDALRYTPRNVSFGWVPMRMLWIVSKRTERQHRLRYRRVESVAYFASRKEGGENRNSRGSEENAKWIPFRDDESPGQSYEDQPHEWDMPAKETDDFDELEDELATGALDESPRMLVSGRQRTRRDDEQSEQGRQGDLHEWDDAEDQNWYPEDVYASDDESKKQFPPLREQPLPDHVYPGDPEKLKAFLTENGCIVKDRIGPGGEYVGVLNCPFCHQKGKPWNKEYNLRIRRSSGIYRCSRCHAYGDWDSLRFYISL
ncbi:hypothetical protein FVE85_0404 [Porphyridium purpureum]|uniref:Uncharacterized protein n=1 Tax=Porphyridium purpureum TaxID=35688 RepID=A0A5J4YZU3_PORPP|nr:hypothetical protein FVE85_0404 [Porphyridium purpureum]|eukprot:POR0017..scf208_2